jgi:hypothetical protein
VRALLTRSLHRLAGAATALFALTLAAIPALSQLPRPIGPISDYGSVLDRHGRERLTSQIETLRAELGIEVFLLATWENPLSEAASLAVALLSAWELERRGPTVLAVFSRDDGSWDHAVVGNRALADDAPLARLEDELYGLVRHDRIEEAMVLLVERLLGDIEPSATGSRDETAARIWPVFVVLAAAAALVWGIHRRICPRCGRLLHVRSGVHLGQEAGRDRVYFCRSCGFRRRR